MQKTIRLNLTLYLIMEIPNKRELQPVASNNFSDKKNFSINLLKAHIHF